MTYEEKTTPKWALCFLILPFCFLTEYFLFAQFTGRIHVSYWWMVYTVLADMGNAAMIHKLAGVK